MGPLFCEPCAKQATVAKLLDDRKLVDGLLAMHQGAKHVETRLEWVASIDPDYLKLQAMRGN